MRRQSISEPNDEWLKRQIDNKEYSSKSELVNDLIRQARNQQQQNTAKLSPILLVINVLYRIWYY